MTASLDGQGGQGSCYFDWEGVFAGTIAGQALQGARRHLATLEGKTKAWNKLSSEIECFQHVNNLRIKTLDQLPLAKLQTSIREARRLCQVTIPLEVNLAACAKFGAELIRTERWDEFAVSCRPWSRPEDATFRDTSPHLSALMSSGRHDAEVAFGDSLLDLFFSDSVVQLFSEPVEKSSLRSMPENLATAILMEYSKVSDDALTSLPPRWFHAMDLILLACRGVVAVCSPIPGHLQSCYQDAQVLFAPEQVEPKDLAAVEALKVVNDAVSKLADIRMAAMKNQHWKARIAAYWTTGLTDVDVADEYNAIVKSLQKEDSWKSTTPRKCCPVCFVVMECLAISTTSSPDLHNQIRRST